MRATLRPLLVLGALASGCGAGPRAPVEGPAFESQLAARPRVLWVAAHPDDESMGAGVLTEACIRHRAVCHFLVLSRGAGGECCIPEGCHPDLATLRHQELIRAARVYGATLEHYDFFNAPLPVESFPTRAGLERKWLGEGDPPGLVARAVRRFRPDFVVSLDPYLGFTGHPEHRATARLTLAGIRLAADPDARGTLFAAEPPHRIRSVVHVLNKYWFMALVGLGNDPPPYTEAFDTDATCAVTRGGEELTCTEVGAESTRLHRSQDWDMRTIRAAEKYWGRTYVRLVDPFGPEADRLIASIGVEDPPGTEEP